MSWLQNPGGAKIWGPVCGPLGQLARSHGVPGVLCKWLSVNPLRAGPQSLFHLGVPSLQSQNPRGWLCLRTAGGCRGEHPEGGTQLSRPHAAALTSPSGKGRVAPGHWFPRGCEHRLVVSSARCLPAKAPGSGHRQGDHMSPLPPWSPVTLPSQTSSQPWGWPHWAQCWPPLATMDGSGVSSQEAHGGRAGARISTALPQGLVVPLLSALHPQEASLCPPPPPSLLPGQASPWPSSTGPELMSVMARSGKGSALHHQHLEARGEVGGFGQSGSGFLVGWFGRGKWISDCFLLSFSVTSCHAWRRGAGRPRSSASPGWGIWVLLLAE